MEQRPDHGSHRLDSLLQQQGVTPVPAVRGALHAKGGYQVLCVSEDLEFTATIAHLSYNFDAHPAIAWSVEDLERLPFWTFHGVLLDTQASREIETRASPRVRKLLARRPMVVTPRADVELGLKALVNDMAAVYSLPTSHP